MIQFNRKVDALVDKLPIRFRPKAKKDIEKLYRTGIRSMQNCIELVRNKGASAGLRKIACWVLGNLGSRTAGDALLVAFGESDAGLCMEAAVALSKIQSKKTVKPLISFLLTEQKQSKRAAAAYSLGFIGDSRAVGPLLKVVSNQNEAPEVRGKAAEALGYLKDQRAVAPLIKALHDEHIEIRFWSAFALGEIGDKQAISALQLLAKLDDSELKGWGSIRKEARKAIRQILG